MRMRMRIVRLLVLCAFAVSVQACATQRFNLQDNPRAVNALPAEDDLDMFFISGIGQTQKRDLTRVCGGASNVGAVEYKLSALSWFIGAVSSGIVTPRDALTYCK